MYMRRFFKMCLLFPLFLSRFVRSRRAAARARFRQIPGKLRDFPRKQPVHVLKKAGFLKKQFVRLVFQNE